MPTGNLIPRRHDFLRVSFRATDQQIFRQSAFDGFNPSVAHNFRSCLYLAKKAFIITIKGDVQKQGETRRTYPEKYLPKGWRIAQRGKLSSVALRDSRKKAVDEIEAEERTDTMNLKITPKAQKMIADQGDSVIVGLTEHICYGWGGAQSRDIPSVRWGIPQPDEIEKYEKMNIDGAVVFIRHEIKRTATARIDAVTGKAGNKLIFLGFVGGG